MLFYRFMCSLRLLCLGAVVGFSGHSIAHGFSKQAAGPSLKGKAAAGPLAGQVVKMVRVDMQAGSPAAMGASQLKSYQYFAEKLSGAANPAGVRFEVSGIDSQLDVTESLNAVRAAIQGGVRYVIQGNMASVALARALSEAVIRYNERHPGDEVILLTDSAIDPELTNNRCTYWHFRFEADTSMKLRAMAAFINDMPDVKKIYLLGPNNAHGMQFAQLAKEALARTRSDVQIVGEALHASAPATDFSAHVARIKAADADTVLTGSWGSDLSGLLQAANEGGYAGRFFTHYATVAGTPAALGKSGQGRVYQISSMHYHMGPQMNRWLSEFRDQYQEDLSAVSVIRVFETLSAAMVQAGSIEPAKVAAALGGLKLRSFNGEIEMRRLDHQLQQPLYMTVWQKAGGKFPYSLDNTGMTLVPLKDFSSYVASLPTSCRMKRP